MQLIGRLQKDAFANAIIEDKMYTISDFIHLYTALAFCILSKQNFGILL